jgi:hypothetical protein
LHVKKIFISSCAGAGMDECHTSPFRANRKKGILPDKDKGIRQCAVAGEDVLELL